MASRSHFASSARTWLAALVFPLVLGFGPGAGATTLTLGLSDEYSGGDEPGGTPPYITATFDDSFGGPNDVRLTLSASNLVGSENVGLWLFNFDPTLDPTQLTFTAVDNAAAVPNSINTGVNAFMAGGGGTFDIQFDFPPPPGDAAALFTAGETVIYDITYISPIDVSSFDFHSAAGGGNGNYLSAAHIMRIGAEAEGSGWIGAETPEPSTALLFGVGLMGLAAVGHRSR